MDQALLGMNISEEEWTATVEALVKALDKRQVAAAEQNEVLDMLALLRPLVVGQ